MVIIHPMKEGPSWKKETLLKYNVDSLSQLPINFSGILLQADEEYGNKVWDKHFGHVYSQLKTKKETINLAVINPFASLQSLSMGSCGTDLIHHLDFLSKAEIYRRYFVKALNDEYTTVSTDGENAYLSNNSFFKSINDFNYKGLNFFSSLNYYLFDLLFLIVWTISLMFFIVFKSRKLIT